MWFISRNRGRTRGRKSGESTKEIGPVFETRVTVTYLRHGDRRVSGRRTTPGDPRSVSTHDTL